jgi:clan AA aspartic protease (TIGR02281 family)
MVSRDLETGIVYSASVFLDEVAVGTITIRNVDALISQGELTQSLLGMSFLSHLSS